MRAADTPAQADLRDLDGDDEEMFPLRSAISVGKMLDCSPDHVHDLMATGQLPYVLIPSGRRDASSESEGRRRRVRNDHLRECVLLWGSSARSHQG